MDIGRLIVTQNYLRDTTQIESMIQFVKMGGKFTKDARLAQSLLSNTGRGTPPPIHIASMEDGVMFLHDGHHRCVSMMLAGRLTLCESEYETVSYSYNDYLLPNFSKGWFTPFDPVSECRSEDFKSFKSEVKHIFENLGDINGALRFINKSPYRYKQNRQIITIQELAQRYLDGTRY